MDKPRISHESTSKLFHRAKSAQGDCYGFGSEMVVLAFDFSAGAKEDKRIAQDLTGPTEEHTWYWLNRRLSGYRRPGEFATMPCTLAICFLCDILRLDGTKKAPDIRKPGHRVCRAFPFIAPMLRRLLR